MSSRALPMQEAPAARERLVRMLAATTFLVFFQAYMVAPLIPAFAAEFATAPQTTGLVVPAYLIPYGLATVLYGLLSDRLGVRPILTASLGFFVVLTALTATANTLGQLVAWRLLTGLGASGIVPLGLVLIGVLYPYEQRGRPLGWMFGAMAGGMAFGASIGAMLASIIGWRGVFLGVSVAGAGTFIWLLRQRAPIAPPRPASVGGVRALLAGYKELLSTSRGRRTYGYVFVNAIFHSGVFTWLGLYLQERYALSGAGIGLVLLGYGIPGFALGPAIGRVADRWGRARLIPAGAIVAALAAAALIFDLPILAAALAAASLSLGYDMTQPLLAGIVTSLAAGRPGQAMGLNVFTLFTGFGIGSMVFGAILPLGFPVALATFSAVQLGAGILAFRLFRSETPHSRTQRTS